MSTNFEELLKKADTGDARAMSLLGRYYAVERNEAKSTEWYRRAAEAGDARARGKCYEKGLGVKKDAVLAAQWYQYAAENGDVLAMYNVGACYQNGDGVTKDMEKAFEWFHKAAENGDAVAMYNVGACYQNGDGVTKDMEKAIEWYYKAADNGEAVAMRCLGVCYHNGDGVTKDMEKAFEWYHKAAENGDAVAMYNVGVCYHNGDGVTKDMVKAIEWYYKAAESGDAVAMRWLGVCYQNGVGVFKDAVKANEWFHKAAENGDTLSMCCLGDNYHNGNGVRTDAAKAFGWYREAAEQGNAMAMYNLGVIFQLGHGVAKDIVKANEWSHKAAENGDAQAMCRLGAMYLSGVFGIKDAVKANEWFHKAAENGNTLAMCALGENYQNGVGVSTDAVKAIEWYRKAAEHGDAVAMRWLGVNCQDGDGAKDAVKRFEWYHKAAENGDAVAMCYLGCNYQNGGGVKKDMEKVIEWYRKASENGDAEAIRWLGVCCQYGYGVAKDAVKATEWYRKAAENGEAEAMMRLGVCFEKGKGVAKDAAKAYEWYCKAAEKGDEEALRKLGRKRGSVVKKIDDTSVRLAGLPILSPSSWAATADGTIATTLRPISSTGAASSSMAVLLSEPSAPTLVVRGAAETASSQSTTSTTSPFVPSPFTTTVVPPQPRDDWAQTPSVALPFITTAVSQTATSTTSSFVPSPFVTVPQPRGDWIRVPHEGTFYYWNRRTNETSWSAPTDSKQQAQRKDADVFIAQQQSVARHPLSPDAAAPVILDIDWQRAMSESGVQEQLASMQAAIAANERAQAELRTAGARLDKRVAANAASIAEHQQRLAELEERRHIQSAQLDVLRNLQHKPAQLLFYRTLLIDLEAVFLSCKAAMGGFVDLGGDAASSKALTGAAKAVKVCGALLSLLPGGALFKGAANVTSAALEQANATRREAVVAQLGKTVTLAEASQVASDVAYRLTLAFAEQLELLAPVEQTNERGGGSGFVAFLKQTCGVGGKLAAAYVTSSGDGSEVIASALELAKDAATDKATEMLATKFGALVGSVASGPEPFASVLAEFCFLCTLAELENVRARETPNEIAERLLCAVLDLKPSAPSSNESGARRLLNRLRGAAKSALSNAPSRSVSVFIRAPPNNGGEPWREVAVFDLLTRCGVRSTTGQKFTATHCDTALFGWCVANEAQAGRRGLTIVSAKPLPVPVARPSGPRGAAADIAREAQIKAVVQKQLLQVSDPARVTPLALAVVVDGAVQLTNEFRGVLYGRCNECEDCDEYVCPIAGGNCGMCGHVVLSHAKLTSNRSRSPSPIPSPIPSPRKY